MKQAHFVFQSYWVVPSTWQSFIENGEMACITSAWSSRKLSLKSAYPINSLKAGCIAPKIKGEILVPKGS